MDGGPLLELGRAIRREREEAAMVDGVTRIVRWGRAGDGDLALIGDGSDDIYWWVGAWDTERHALNSMARGDNTGLDLDCHETTYPNVRVAAEALAEMVAELDGVEVVNGLDDVLKPCEGYTLGGWEGDNSARIRYFEYPTGGKDSRGVVQQSDFRAYTWHNRDRMFLNNRKRYDTIDQAKEAVDAALMELGYTLTGGAFKALPPGTPAALMLFPKIVANELCLAAKGRTISDWHLCVERDDTGKFQVHIDTDPDEDSSIFLDVYDTAVDAYAAVIAECVTHGWTITSDGSVVLDWLASHPSADKHDGRLYLARVGDTGDLQLRDSTGKVWRTATAGWDVLGEDGQAIGRYPNDGAEIVDIWRRQASPESSHYSCFMPITGPLNTEYNELVGTLDELPSREEAQKWLPEAYFEFTPYGTTHCHGVEIEMPAPNAPIVISHNTSWARGSVGQYLLQGPRGLVRVFPVDRNTYDVDAHGQPPRDQVTVRGVHHDDLSDVISNACKEVGIAFMVTGPTLTQIIAQTTTERIETMSEPTDETIWSKINNDPTVGMVTGGAAHAGKLVLGAQAAEISIRITRKVLARILPAKHLELLDDPVGQVIIGMCAPALMHAAMSHAPVKDLIPGSEHIAKACAAAFQGQLTRYGIQFSDQLVDIFFELGPDLKGLKDLGKAEAARQLEDQEASDLSREAMGLDAQKEKVVPAQEVPAKEEKLRVVGGLGTDE